MDPLTWTLLIFLVFLVIVVAVQQYFLMQYQKKFSRLKDHPIGIIYLEADPRTALVKVYEMLCEELQKSGYLRKDFETVREFGDAVKKAVPTIKLDLTVLDALFEEARYSGHTISQQQIWEALQRLEAILLELSLLVEEEEEIAEEDKVQPGEVELPPAPEPGLGLASDEE